jgi:hypothetical protein
MFKSKGTSISFRIEDDVAKAVQEAANLEDLTVADFVRKIFRYGFYRYTVSGQGLFPLLQEQRDDTLRRKAAEVAARDAKVLEKVTAAEQHPAASRRKVSKAS